MPSCRIVVPIRSLCRVPLIPGFASAKTTARATWTSCWPQPSNWPKKAPSFMTSSPIGGGPGTRNFETTLSRHRSSFAKESVPTQAISIATLVSLARSGTSRAGRDAFYAGEIDEDMITTLQNQGGLHTMEDFATFEGSYVKPIMTTYRGIEVYECPPNGQGIAALLMLGALSSFDFRGGDPLAVPRLHYEIEAGRLAMRERDRLIGDPDFTAIPVHDLLSPSHLTSLAASIDPGQATQHLPVSSFELGRDSSHVSIVDDDGNAVSFIGSLFHEFGSGIVCPESGVTLNNRAFGFSLIPDHPNTIAPRKRPLHTIIPGMAVDPGRKLIPFGVVGGHYQPWGHTHVLTNLVDYAMDVQEAIDLPRVFHNGTRVEIEAGIPDQVHAELSALGHNVRRRLQSGAKDIGPLGGGQLIEVDLVSGVLAGAADPRMDGCALGY